MPLYRQLISVAELQAMPEGACRIVDCRHDLLQSEKGLAEYREGHIPDAIHADMDKDLASTPTSETGRHPLPQAEDFAVTLGAWGIGNETQVVAYDSGSGALAARLWWMLRWLGHEAVAVLDGGLAAWKAAGGRISMDTPQPAVATFEPHEKPDLIVSTADVMASISADQRMLVLDARDAGRFAGEVEPIDPVAGHVPGAVNLPLARNLRPDGFWRSPVELSALWNAVAGREDGPPPVAMCGSGVTACHLVLSAVIAGRPEPRLYAGSWSEWIRDPARPVASES